MKDPVPGDDPPEGDGVARVPVRDAAAKRKPNASKQQKEARTSSPAWHPPTAPEATQVPKLSTATQIRMRLLMRQGHSTAQIAGILGLSLQTVASYLGTSVDTQDSITDQPVSR